MPDPGKKVANSLVAMSSAAILAVYGAGYTRTRAAARRLEAQSEARIPAPIEVAAPLAPTSPPSVQPSPKSTHARASAPVGEKAQPATPAQIDLPAPPPPPAVASPAVAETLLTPEPTPPLPTPPPPPPAPKWKDGTYYGWGTSRHGDIQAAVIVESGRIASATIAQCLTRYSCNVISKLPPEVPERQSPDVDYVSGATQSANAFYYAVVDALSKAK
jgi:uncharacterized protein with FMN-binding domain